MILWGEGVAYMIGPLCDSAEGFPRGKRTSLFCHNINDGLKKLYIIVSNLYKNITYLFLLFFFFLDLCQFFKTFSVVKFVILK